MVKEDHKSEHFFVQSTFEIKKKTKPKMHIASDDAFSSQNFCPMFIPPPPPPPTPHHICAPHVV